MKKVRLFSILALIVILALTVLVGCEEEDKVSSIALKDHEPDSIIEVPSGEFDFGAYTLVVSRASGAVEEIPLTEEMIREDDLVKFYQVGYHDITISYGEQSYAFKISVLRSTFEGLGFPENNVFTYDGNPHTVEVQGDIPANAVVSYVSGNSFVNAGTYDVNAIVSCDGYVTVTLSTTVTIQRAVYDMSGVTFEDKEFVYDGTLHSIEIEGTLPEGVSEPTYVINEKIASGATDVGEYTVIAKFDNTNPNYEEIPNMETTLKIIPADFTLTDVGFVYKNSAGETIDGATKVYDGTSVSFDLDDYGKLTNRISVSFSVYDEDGNLISNSNRNTNIVNAGVYTVKAEFTLADGKNYNPVEPLYSSFEVTKADYTIGNVAFDSEVFVYDGNPHGIEISGVLPAGVTVTYEYYLNDTLIVDDEGNALQAVTDAGRYTVVARFMHTDENRSDIESISAVLQITQAEFDISMLDLQPNTSLVYDGAGKWITINGAIPEGLAAEIKYYVDGVLVENPDGTPATAVTDVAKYDVYVTFLGTNDNYVPLGMLSYEFAIEKASIDVNGVTVNGSRECVYDGSDHLPSINGETVPANISITQALYSVSAQGVRAAVTSAVDAGSYVAVFNISLTDSNNYRLVGRDTIEWEFSVIPKHVDVSGVHFDTAELTFNGNQQLPSLMGVPEHVNDAVTVYTLDGAQPISEYTNAGKYRCEAVLTAESANYVLSSTEKIVFEFEILTQKIDVSNLQFDSTVFWYNGEKQHPILVDIPANVECGVILYSVYPYTGDSFRIPESVNSGDYAVEIVLGPESYNYELLGPTQYTTNFKIKAHAVNIDTVLSNGISIEFKAGGYDLAALGEALNKALFGDTSDCFEVSVYEIKFGTDEVDAVNDIGAYEAACYVRAIGVQDSEGFDHYNYAIEYDGRVGIIAFQITIPFEVPSDYVISAVLDSADFVYDGTARCIEINGTIPAEVTVTYEYYLNGTLIVDGEGNPVQEVTDAGNYTVVAHFTHADPNVINASPLSAELQITPAEFDISSLDLQMSAGLLYDGTEKFAILNGALPAGLDAEIKYYANGILVENPDGTPATSVIDAGEYTVRVTLTGVNNYNLIGGDFLELDFAIIPQPVDVSGVYLSGAEFTYNGEVQQPTLNGLPEHALATVSIYPFGETRPIDQAVNAGKYRCEAALTAESANYELSSTENLVLEFEIHAITIDLGTLIFDSTYFSYTGRDQHPTLLGVPEHVTLTYRIYDTDGIGLIESIDKADYRCDAILTPESSNYVLVGETLYSTTYKIGNIVIALDERFADPFVLEYTDEGYNDDDLKALLLAGINGIADCDLNSYRISIGDDQWQYSATMKAVGLYRVEIGFELVDDVNYIFSYNGNLIGNPRFYVYFEVV